MRYLIIILIFISCKANAVVYYISNAGSDAANGTSTGTSWQTISKVNSSSFSAGDQILFKKGDSWIEKLVVPSSGSVGNVITFGSYGSGVKPLITGFITLAMSDQGGNIWSATATSSVLNQNTVTIEGAIKAKGRYPNSSYLTNVSFPSTTQLIVPHSATNYTGYGIAVRTARWVIDVTKISSVLTGATNDTLNFSTPTTYNTLGGYYFFQNKVAILDTLGEWAYDSTTKVLSVYATSSPTVQYSSIDTLVYLHNVSYITFDGIKFTGSNQSGIEMNNAFHCIIQNCVFDSHGANAITETYAPVNTKVGDIQVLYDTITNCLSNGYYSDPDTSIVVNYNYIKNIGIYAGMGKNSSNSYTGIYNLGLTGSIARPNIVGNRVDSCGYNGIRFRGKVSLIKNNYVTNFCFNKDDGAGIYTFVGNGDQTLDTGSIVRSNIVLNGIGAAQFPADTYRYGNGIYLDNGSRGITVDSNTVSGTTNASMFLHQAADITLRGNIVWDSMATVLYIDGFYSVTFGLNIKSNILFSKKSTTYCFYSSYKDSTNTFIDSNYYYRPVATTNNLHMGSVTSQMTAWIAATGYDTNSSSTLPATNSSSTPILIYNPTLNDSTVTLVGNYVDIFNNQYLSRAVLHSFQSKLIFPSSYTYVSRTNFKFRLR